MFYNYAEQLIRFSLNCCKESETPVTIRNQLSRIFDTEHGGTLSPHTQTFKAFRMHNRTVKGIDQIFAADLVDVQPFSRYNNVVKYHLTVIDIFSKYGWILPLKNNTGLQVASALEKVLKERKPDKLWLDKGKEFYNSHVQKLLPLYSTENEEKETL